MICSRPLAALVLVLSFFGTACSPAPRSSNACDPIGAVRRARAAHLEVTVCGAVVSVRRIRRTRSGVHQTFIVATGANDRIEVDANLDVMGNLPVRRGERAIVRGEYYADASGRDGVHWTHRTLRGTHPPGYVVLDGTTYN